MSRQQPTNIDDLLRSVARIAETNTPAIESLTRLSDSDLFSALGQRLTSDEPAIASPIDPDDLLRTSALQNLGRSVFRRWNNALHDFVCKSSGEDQALRDKLIQALTGKEGGTAIIAGILVAAFGASPAIAAILATLLIRIIVAPAASEICKAWTAALAKPL